MVGSGVPGEPYVLSICGTHVPGLWLRRGLSDGPQTLLGFPKHHPEATSIPRIPPETRVPSGSPDAISRIWGPPSWRHTPLPCNRAGTGRAPMTRHSSSVQTSKGKTTDTRVRHRGHSVPHGHRLLPGPMPFLSTRCRGPAPDRPTAQTRRGRRETVFALPAEARGPGFRLLTTSEADRPPCRQPYPDGCSSWGHTLPAAQTPLEGGLAHAPGPRV